MPTQQEINLAAYKSGKKPEEIQALLQAKGIPPAPTITPVQTIKPSEVTAPAWATYWEANILPPSVTGFSTPKPIIATTDKPVIGTPPATNTPIGDFSKFTPEQNYSKAMEIYTKDPSEVTKEEISFVRSLKFRMDNGEDIYGKKGKSSWTTTYSTELVQPWENIASSTRNADGSYQVTYKDWTSQRTTTEPSTTVFPEWTPEYFAQKRAEAWEERARVLAEQLTDFTEKRAKETADLVAKYGENIASQFQSQKAEIEAQWAKRMEETKSMLAGRGAGRSGIAIEKVDEIAKNIETTITQAKAKADLELMAYRMEQEGADAEAISAIRTNIANVQANIDQANYENQLEIIKLNQENATTGSEAMMNLLNTISNGAELSQEVDMEKSAELWYFINKKTWQPMFDSQRRALEFKKTASWLTPDQISTFASLLKTWKVDEEWLKKIWLTSAEIADVTKHSQVLSGDYVAPVSVVDFIKSKEWFREQAYDDATGNTLALWETPAWTATIWFWQTTINWVPVKWWDTISQADADAEMRKQIDQKYSRYKSLVTVPLNETQKAALTSLEYNVWPWVWWFAAMKPVLAAINESDFNKAADLLVQSGIGIRNAKTWQTLPWLIARRQEEADMLRQTGTWATTPTGGDTALTTSDISIFNNSTYKPQLEKDATLKKKYQVFLDEKNKVMKDKNASIEEVMGYSQWGKDLTDTDTKTITKFSQALDQISWITEQIKKIKTWPILWRIRAMNPYDTDAQTLASSLNWLIPNLARWVYGEVWVLTDNDIRIYARTVPNLTQTNDVNNAVLALTLDTIAWGYKRQLQTLAAAWKDVSGFAGLYDSIKAQADSIKASIPGFNTPPPTGGERGSVTWNTGTLSDWATFTVTFE